VTIWLINIFSAEHYREVERRLRRLRRSQPDVRVTLIGGDPFPLGVQLHAAEARSTQWLMQAWQATEQVEPASQRSALAS
jgi:hypothetical protein